MKTNLFVGNVNVFRYCVQKESFKNKNKTKNP